MLCKISLTSPSPEPDDCTARSKIHNVVADEDLSRVSAQISNYYAGYEDDGYEDDGYEDDDLQVSTAPQSPTKPRYKSCVVRLTISDTERAVKA
jgi:hypothetical protein